MRLLLVVGNDDRTARRARLDAPSVAERSRRYRDQFVAQSVLICDDNKMLRTFVKTSLVRDGYTCAEAPDASESVRLAKSMRPDVVILDVMMPGGSGLDVLAELRRDPDLARTPVVLITAAARTFESLRAQDYGAERCLIKPFRHAQLRSAVEAALAR